MFFFLKACIFIYLARPTQAVYADGHVGDPDMYTHCETVDHCDDKDCPVGEVAYCGDDNLCHCKLGVSHLASTTHEGGCEDAQLGDYILDPADRTCQSYMYCGSSGAVRFQCPGDTIFDTKHSVCNHRCGGASKCEWGARCPYDSADSQWNEDGNGDNDEDDDEDDDDHQDPQTMISPCHGIECQNGGFCVENGGEAQCTCATGYAGDLCEHSDIRCDTMYDCDRRCGKPNTQCLDVGYCDCSGNAPVSSNAMYAHRTHTVGSSCTMNHECHGICDQPLQGRCRVPEFVCDCQDLGDMKCDNNNDCHQHCDSHIGECGPDGYCVCELNNFQLSFGWKNELDEKLHTLENKTTELLTLLFGAPGSLVQDPPPPKVTAKPPCQTTADCRDECGANNYLVVCLANGDCVC